MLRSLKRLFQTAHVQYTSFHKLSTDQSKMPLKFAANISMMFLELPSLEARYSAAKKAGFQYVELTFPYGESVDSLRAAREASGLEQVLINAFPGDLSAGDLGLAAQPDRVQEFREKLELSISYATGLQCKRMHIMAGRIPAGADDGLKEKMMSTYLDNIKYAADRLQKEGILALIEPVNNRISVPGYFLSNPHKGLEIVKQVNHPNLKLQFDIFHVQIMDGNLTKNIEAFLPYIGHIQIAQVPDRGEPDETGEINYPYVFSVLERVGYEGYIGLEYKPKGKTEDGLKWLRSLGY
ncbi:putative hydroxypyruvate isomerase [Aplysia californica]|uniref:Putative hydroxypyruvate isomerase n=1 Tax=Aplysia californica TaxID=6500 RepID=A0ABM0JBX6_APLCA|nr:putative hydroxypyruvate isomerase [Aplysia californica]